MRRASTKVSRLFHLLVNGTNNDADNDNDNDAGIGRRRCPRCGGRLEPNAGGPGDSVLFGASPPQELGMRCLTGHDANWTA